MISISPHLKPYQEMFSIPKSSVNYLSPLPYSLQHKYMPKVEVVTLGSIISDVTSTKFVLIWNLKSKFMCVECFVLFVGTTSLGGGVI